jgi:hypothetical protein
MQGSYSVARQAGGRAAGQLLPHTTAVARSKAQQQRQQLQQRWQQQAQQQQQQVDRPPATAPAANGRCGASGLEACAAGADEDSGCNSTNSGSTQPAQGWKDQQQEQQQAAASSRPSTAAAAAQAAPRNRRQQTAQTAGNSSTVQQQQQLQGVATHAEACSPWLQPADVEHLTEAQSWVQNWPEAVGNTRLLTALITAHQYTFSSSSSSSSGDSIDSYYLFSDGLADDAAACLEWVRQQEEAGQPLRPVHTVGE